MSEATALHRDEKGRPVGEDGYPIGGLATVQEFSAVTQLGLSTSYAMVASGEVPSKSFGRCRRIEWKIIREMFLSGEVA